MALYIGLISGTSVDAIDAVLCEIPESSETSIKLLHSLNLPYPPELKTQLLHFGQSQYEGDAIDQLGQLDHQVALLFAKATQQLLAETNYQPQDIKALGSHGQTVRHRPEVNFPFTLQIGDPSIIAAQTGITTVADFRRRDMALGGQGAPFAPAFHHQFFSKPNQNRAVVNLGGIANITLLLPGKAPLGFDTGPANTLMDQWIFQQKQLSYDKDGTWAETGQVIPELLDALLVEPYFSQEAPKSTGCEYFNMNWVKDKTTQLNLSQFRPQDVQRTLLQLTALTVSNMLNQWMPEGDVFLCGGGAHNPVLQQEIQKLLPSMRVANTNELGIEPDWVEAMTFAWFASKTIHQQPVSLASITGAKSNSILGGIYLKS